MKILTALSVIQICAILVLYTKLAGIDDESHLAAVKSQPAQVSGTTTAARTRHDSVDSNSVVSEELLRRIVREELSAQLGGQVAVTQADSSRQATLIDSADNQSRRDQVARLIEYHSSVGTVSAADMQSIQSEIAKLDPASRTEMLRALNAAINSGRLEGRL